MSGVLNISLDFELHWGRFDKVQLDAKNRPYFENTRAMFPRMVKLFLDHEVKVTWATVGMLYHRNAEEWRQYKPSVLPAYANPKVSSYEWVKEYGLLEPEDPYHFAPELIDLIDNQPLFEIGTHTYSHYYCQEEGQTIDDFRRDLELAILVQGKRGHRPRSLVFPRNQFNEAYLDVCRDLGITAVRSNPDCWYWDATREETLLTKVFRTGDAYSKFLKSKVVPLSSIDFKRSPVLLPASRLYRAWTSKSNMLNKLKMRRILDEMTHAARTEGYYHLWWHPHNFGWNPEECLKELEVILRHYHILKQKYGFRSLTMNEMVNY